MFGYVQCSGILIAPICSLLFNKREKNEVDANDEFLGNVKILILPSVVVTMVLVLMNILLMVENIILMVILLPVTRTDKISFVFNGCHLSMKYSWILTYAVHISCF